MMLCCEFEQMAMTNNEYWNFQPLELSIAMGKKISDSQPVLQPNRNIFIFKGKPGSPYDRQLIVSFESDEAEIIPKFNRVKFCPTPAFFLPKYSQEAVKLARNFSDLIRRQRLKAEHVSSVAGSFRDLAPTRKAIKYCRVCCEPYDSYQRHILEEIHRYKTKFCISSKFIKEISNSLQLQRDQTTRTIQTKQQSRTQEANQ